MALPPPGPPLNLQALAGPLPRPQVRILLVHVRRGNPPPATPTKSANARFCLAGWLAGCCGFLISKPTSGGQTPTLQQDHPFCKFRWRDHPFRKIRRGRGLPFKPRHASSKRVLCASHTHHPFSISSGASIRGFLGNWGFLAFYLKNRSFWGSGRPRTAQKPFKKVGGKAPYLFKRFLGRPGPPRTPK